MVRKKSRKGFVFEAIWICSGKFESARPAKKPPISRVKPIGPPTKAATPKAQAILEIKRSSVECAKNWSKIRGIKDLDKNQTPKIKTAALTAIKPNSAGPTTPPFIPDKNIKITTATRSCIKSTPSEILP